MTAERSRKIEELLSAAFTPTQILVKDQSHLHAGHAGAQDGKGHFAVDIVSTAFAGLSRLERHRRIFDALGEMMDTDIHALKIKATTPDESNAS
ncbi:MAG: BolA family transcriptional regulator [Proteobacteria bacterium]|nr:BolA family transcriptional regulator [Pseudomonadota bacterium]MCH8136344.1 BolA family transcriptional regulator [Pseudomonadota bacterium]